MPFVPVPDTLEAEVRCSLDSQGVENTLYFTALAPWTPTSGKALGDALRDWWISNLSPNLSNRISLVEVYVTDLSSATGFTATSLPTGTPVGGVNEEPVPNNVSPCISFRTDSRGRSYRGRNYVPGLPNAAVNTNTLEVTVAGELAAAYEELFTIASDFSGSWVVVSRYSGVDPVTKRSIPREIGVVTPITAVLFTDLIVDSQRRRLPKRGR
jgi:hypothetical protein